MTLPTTPSCGSTSPKSSPYERWETVVSQAVIFLEDRLRKWSGRPETEYGVNLVANVASCAFRSSVMSRLTEPRTPSA